MKIPCLYPWEPVTVRGTYRNPILHADYSDPDVIRHGEDFWMTASSFQCTPGLPILHSRDMVHWELVNHALQQVPHPRYTDVQPGCGVWAPALRHHAGKFWIFFPMPDEGIYVTCAEDPRGTWETPWCLQEAKGWIDPCPFWDDDGQAYLAHAYANSRAGKKERIHLRPMSADGRCLLGEGRELFHTPHHLYLEGPKLHKKDGYYYVMAPGGGVQTGWQVAFRSRSIWGPYEEKIVLEQGRSQVNGPHQGAFVELANGDWWFYHFQDCGPYGRITHLQPVTWEEGWPKIGVDLDGNGVGEPVEEWPLPDIGGAPLSWTRIPDSDEFDSGTPGRQWQWQANHQAGWADLHARPGWLRLHAQPCRGDQIGMEPHFYGQKFPARSFRVTTRLDHPAACPGSQAGLAIVGGGESTWVGLLKKNTPTWTLVLVHNGQILQDAEIPSSCVELSVHVNHDALCEFSWRVPESPWNIYSQRFACQEGGWIGARVGLFHSTTGTPSEAAYADFDYFRFST